MSEWQNKTDFEINQAVASLIGVKVSANQYHDYEDRDENTVLVNVFIEGDSAVNYCNNPSDAWPIIINNNIVVTPCMGNNAGDATGYLKNDNSTLIEFNDNKHALRAAMIVFLEMNGVKP